MSFVLTDLNREVAVTSFVGSIHRMRELGIHPVMLRGLFEQTVKEVWG